MTWEEFKEEAKKMGYVEEPILENGIVWLTKKRLDFDLCFNNDGMVLFGFYGGYFIMLIFG